MSSKIKEASRIIYDRVWSNAVGPSIRRSKDQMGRTIIPANKKFHKNDWLFKMTNSFAIGSDKDILSL